MNNEMASVSSFAVTLDPGTNQHLWPCTCCGRVQWELGRLTRSLQGCCAGRICTGAQKTTTPRWDSSPPPSTNDPTRTRWDHRRPTRRVRLLLNVLMSSSAYIVGIPSSTFSLRLCREVLVHGPNQTHPAGPLCFLPRGDLRALGTMRRPPRGTSCAWEVGPVLAVRGLRCTRNWKMDPVCSKFPTCT